MTITIEERSLQLALIKAAGQLEVTQDCIGYKILQDKKGFLGFFGRKVQVAVWKKKKSGKGRSSFDSVPRGPRPVLSAEETTALKTDLHTFLTKICSLMTGDQVEIDIFEDGDRLILDIDHDHLCQHAGRHSKLAESFEHLLRKKPHYLHHELPFRLFVDFRGTRRDRENELMSMAQDLSVKVFESKRPVVLDYRNSYDRKIIHMALDKDERVYTKSIGNGPNRKLMILPHKKRETTTSEANA